MEGYPFYRNTRNITIKELTAINNLINAISDAQDVLAEMPPHIHEALREILLYYTMMYPGRTFIPVRLALRPVFYPEEYLHILPLPGREWGIPIMQYSTDYSPTVRLSLPTMLQGAPPSPQNGPEGQIEHQPRVAQFLCAGPPPFYAPAGPSARPIPVVDVAQPPTLEQLEHLRLDMIRRHEAQLAHNALVKRHEERISRCIAKYSRMHQQRVTRNWMDVRKEPAFVPIQEMPGMAADYFFFMGLHENYETPSVHRMTTPPPPPQWNVSQEIMQYALTGEVLPPHPPIGAPLRIPAGIDRFVQPQNPGANITPSVEPGAMAMPPEGWEPVYPPRPTGKNYKTAANSVALDRQSSLPTLQLSSDPNLVTSTTNQLASSVRVLNVADADAAVAGPSTSGNSLGSQWRNQPIRPVYNLWRPDLGNELCDSNCPCRANMRPK